MVFSDAIRYTLEKRSLTADEAYTLMALVLDGQVTPAQLGAWLAGLASKGETADEILGFVRALRSRSCFVPWSGSAIDVCGTGGDHSYSFNASTAAALIVSAAGVPVAKAGNRAASSLCGSADVLEAAGIAIELEPADAALWLQEHQFAFLFSQKYHPALRQLAPIRRELGFRTAFNLLGPLCNPVRLQGQVVGVAHRNLAPLLAEALCALGIQHALVVHSLDGLDEFSLSAPAEVHEVIGGRITRSIVDPQNLNLPHVEPAKLGGGTPPENADTLRRMLHGERSPLRDFCVLNAAAGLIVAGRVGDFREGIDLATNVIDSGAAAARLADLIAQTALETQELTPHVR